MFFFVKYGFSGSLRFFIVSANFFLPLSLRSLNKVWPYSLPNYLVCVCAISGTIFDSMKTFFRLRAAQKKLYLFGSVFGAIFSVNLYYMLCNIELNAVPVCQLDIDKCPNYDVENDFDFRSKWFLSNTNQNAIERIRTERKFFSQNVNLAVSSACSDIAEMHWMHVKRNKDETFNLTGLHIVNAVVFFSIFLILSVAMQTAGFSVSLWVSNASRHLPCI